MSRPCDRWCPFTACDSCPWKGGEWTCQVCGGPATEDDGAVCTKCGQNRRSEPVDAPTNDTRVVLESEGRTKTVPGGAGNANGDLTTGTSPALLGEGGKPDGYPA